VPGERGQMRTQAKSFEAVALDHVKGLIQDELRWIRKLEDQLESGKGEVTWKAAHTHQITARQS
jgi:hypothetical protein